MEQYNEEDLIRLVQEGSDEAFQELYHRYVNYVYYLAYQIMQNDADAQDVVQETFIRIKCSISSLREVSVFKLWLRRIITNNCNNIFRKKKPLYFEDDLLQVLNNDKEDRPYMLGELNSHFKSDQEQLDYFIKQLSSLHQEVISLMYFQQLSTKEIAQLLKIPEGTVKTRVSNARKILKQKISKYEKSEQVHLNFQASPIATLFATATLEPGFLRKLLGNQPKQMVKRGVLTASTAFVVVSGATVVLPELLHQNTTGVEANPVSLSNQNSTNPTPIEKQPIEFHPITVNFETYYNAKDAYFALLEFAEVSDIMNKDTEDCLEMKPLYDEVMKNDTAYRSELLESGWSEKFILKITK